METNTKKETRIKEYEILDRETFGKKVWESCRQRKQKKKTGVTWSEDRKQQNSDRMREYWKTRKSNQKYYHVVHRWPN